MKLKLIRVVALALIVVLAFFISKNMRDVQRSDKNIKYVAIGDSYTIGLGIDEKGRWPNVMTVHLKEKGINVELVANPSVSGYTVRDAIEIELPLAANIKPDFVTVLIGANDNFMQRSRDDYHADLTKLLDRLQPMLSDPKNIVLITIPDYSKSPTLQETKEEGLSEFIDGYNDVIKEEAETRGLPVADIFPVSQTMTGDDDYILDGLHPSAQGYAKWEKVIFPVVFNLLKN